MREYLISLLELLKGIETTKSERVVLLVMEKEEAVLSQTCRIFWTMVIAYQVLKGVIIWGKIALILNLKTKVY